jgi:hypothetical protein
MLCGEWDMFPEIDIAQSIHNLFSAADEGSSSCLCGALMSLRVSSPGSEKRLGRIANTDIRNANARGDHQSR